MAKKQKDSKHEKARKTVADTVRAPAKAAKRIHQAKPRLARSSAVGKSSKAVTRFPILPDQSESVRHDATKGFEVHRIDRLEREPEVEIYSYHTAEVEVVELELHPGPALFESEFSMPQRWEAVQTSDYDLDLGYKNAEEQVALAMLEAEQAAAFCQGADDFNPWLHSFDPESSSMASVRPVDNDSEDQTYPFDHI
jgi:hypothetical protein